MKASKDRQAGMPWAALRAIDEETPGPSAPGWIHAFSLARALRRGDAGAIDRLTKQFREAPESALLSVAWAGVAIERAHVPVVAALIESVDGHASAKETALVSLLWSDLRLKPRTEAFDETIDVDALVLQGKKLKAKTPTKTIRPWLEAVAAIPSAAAEALVPKLFELFSHPTISLRSDVYDVLEAWLFRDSASLQACIVETLIATNDESGKLMHVAAELGQPQAIECISRKSTRGAFYLAWLTNDVLGMTRAAKGNLEHRLGVAATAHGLDAWWMKKRRSSQPLAAALEALALDEDERVRVTTLDTLAALVMRGADASFAIDSALSMLGDQTKVPPDLPHASGTWQGRTSGFCAVKLLGFQLGRSGPEGRLLRELTRLLGAQKQAVRDDAAEAIGLGLAWGGHTDELLRALADADETAQNTILCGALFPRTNGSFEMRSAHPGSLLPEDLARALRGIGKDLAAFPAAHALLKDDRSHFTPAGVARTRDGIAELVLLLGGPMRADAIRALRASAFAGVDLTAANVALAGVVFDGDFEVAPALSLSPLAAAASYGANLDFMAPFVGTFVDSGVPAVSALGCAVAAAAGIDVGSRAEAMLALVHDASSASLAYAGAEALCAMAKRGQR